MEGKWFTISSPLEHETDDDLPPHPDNFRDGQGVLDRPAWVAALAEWRGADTEAAPPDEDGAATE